MQTLDNRSLNFGLKNYVKKQDISKVTDRESPEFQAVSKFSPSLYFSLLTDFPHLSENLKLAKDLEFYKKISKRLDEDYLDYPKDPERFPSWHENFQSDLQQIYDRFPIEN